MAALTPWLMVFLVALHGPLVRASGASQDTTILLVSDDEPALASPEETAEALASFSTWATAFQAGDYDQVWLMTDPRIRQWFDPKRWEKRMKGAQKERGEER